MTEGPQTGDWEPQIAPRALRPPATGFPVGLTIAAAIAFAILIGLGVWQLQRLKWKEGLLAHIAAAEAAPARPIEPVLDALANGHDVDFTRVRVTCRGLAHAPTLELYALRNAEIGSRLISACPVISGVYRSILVDRGFVPDTVTARPLPDPYSADPVEVVGVLRAPERGNFMTPKNTPRRWFLHDAKAMAAALGADRPVAPVFLMAATSSNPDFKALEPAPFPIDIPNHHLEYALTWFGLAGGLAGVYGAAVFKRMKG
ncbi:MAG: SURF1 family protein [Caulobacterales bacterium]|jgi:surfeit locus 1 family protein